MGDKENVSQFLHAFRQKAKVFGMVFRDDRGKNIQTLADLEITSKYREDVIMGLAPEDYIAGPVDDTLNRLTPLWVFGRKVKNRDVYIKISMGLSNTSAVCISFHIAEHELKYKFK